MIAVFFVSICVCACELITLLYTDILELESGYESTGQRLKATCMFNFEVVYIFSCFRAKSLHGAEKKSAIITLNFG